MILDTTVKVKINKKNLQHYIKFFPKISLGEILNIDPKYLISGSNMKINVKCDLCDEERFINYQMYHRNLNKCESYKIYTCDKCSHIKIKEFNKKKYGCEYYSQTTEYNNKFRKTMMERYGVEYSQQSLELKEKSKKTNLSKFGFENPFQDTDMIKSKFREKWGFDHPSQVDEIKSKIEETNIQRYGTKNPLSSPEIREKINLTLLEKYGGHPMLNESVRFDNTYISRDRDYIKYQGNNISLFRCGLGHDFEITSETYHNRLRGNIPLCTVCYPISELSSIKEKELMKFISSKYNGLIVENHRDGLEIDIYLPELKIGFEFNGIYWHSESWRDKNYHLKKSVFFEEKGIRIVNIWEDDWDERKDIVKSMITNLLKTNTSKLYARNCEVIEIKDTETIRNFLNQNHIQGYVGSIIKIGLVHQGKIVAVMTFDQFEGRKKMNEGEWNLSRFCNMLGLNVVGGASKLMSYFMKKWNPNRIISYADRDWSVGHLYEKLGFEKKDISKPDYKYVIRNKRVHKSKFRKSKLNTDLSESEYMKTQNIPRIWDCGKIKYQILIYKKD